MNWIYKGKDDVIFDTASNKKKKEKIKNVKRFLLAAFVLILLALFLIFKQYNFDLSSASGSKKEEKTTVEETTKRKVKYSNDQSTFLFFCSDDEKTKLEFLSAVRFDLKNDKIYIHPIDINGVNLTYRDFSGNISATPGNCFKSGGKAMLVEGCESYLGKKIDKYIGTTQTDLQNIIINFPSVKIDIEEDLTLSRNGDKVYFPKGIREISDANVFKYMTYNGRNNTEDLLKDQGKVFEAGIKGFINESFVENTDVIFERVINLSDSNISTFDVKSHKNDLEYFAGNNEKIKCEILLSIEDFSEILSKED